MVTVVVVLAAAQWEMVLLLVPQRRELQGRLEQEHHSANIL